MVIDVAPYRAITGETGAARMRGPRRRSRRLLSPPAPGGFDRSSEPAGPCSPHARSCAPDCPSDAVRPFAAGPARVRNRGPPTSPPWRTGFGGTPPMYSSWLGLEPLAPSAPKSSVAHRSAGCERGQFSTTGTGTLIRLNIASAFSTSRGSPPGRGPQHGPDPARLGGSAARRRSGREVDDEVVELAPRRRAGTADAPRRRARARLRLPAGTAKDRDGLQPWRVSGLLVVSLLDGWPSRPSSRDVGP